MPHSPSSHRPPSEPILHAMTSPLSASGASDVHAVVITRLNEDGSDKPAASPVSVISLFCAVLLIADIPKGSDSRCWASSIRRDLFHYWSAQGIRGV